MIRRTRELTHLQALLRRYPVVGIIGARQVGRTTLARALVRTLGGAAHCFDLEDPEDLARMAEPALSLKGLRGLVVIDEVQRRPDVFSVLRVLADRGAGRARYLVLGSASPELLRQSAESLAGRIAYHVLDGFAFDDVPSSSWDALWVRGGFPPAFLAPSEAASLDWRRRFIQTFLERDLPQLGVAIRSATLRRFWVMLAHYHGQTWNASEFGRAFGIADTTVRHYLDILTSALVIRQLPPWHANIAKRQVKAPKVYVRDSGLLHALLDIRTRQDLERHPKVGASWEGFLIHQIIRRLEVAPDACFYWATHAGAELDLLVRRGRAALGFEVKRTVQPHITPSMRAAVADLRLDRLDVVHAGDSTFALDRRIRAVSWRRLLQELQPLRSR